MPIDIELTNDVNVVFSRYKEENISVYYLEKGNPKQLDKEPIDILSSII